MEATFLAIVLKPLILFLLAACILYPARRLAMRYLPDGKVKRALLTRLS